MKTDKKWVQTHKDVNKASAIASLGLLHLWDEEEGVSILETYLNEEDEHYRSGGILGIGFLSFLSFFCFNHLIHSYLFNIICN